MRSMVPAVRPSPSTKTLSARQAVRMPCCPASAVLSGRPGALTLPYIEQKVLEQRHKGITTAMRSMPYSNQCSKRAHPSPSTIYAICKRLGVNRLTPTMKAAKRTIIKTRAGELGHLDCHYLSRDLILGTSQRYYLVSVLDACTRLVWTEVVSDLKSLSVMFAALKSINLLNAEYGCFCEAEDGIQFEAILTDNGPEVASRTKPEQHPFECMLLELGIRHRYTRPYRPQTNGKVERFWRTLNDDLIEGTTFENLAEFKDELMQYLLYYNTARPHQGLQGNTRLQALQNLSTN